MYLIPDDFSPERLKGKTIEQVCYSINQIGLFWENGNIQIMGSFSFSRNGRTHVYEEIYPVTEDPGLLCLLQQQITDANISSARDSLSLYFSNQSVLVLHSNPHFESFIIDDRIIVWSGRRK